MPACLGLLSAGLWGRSDRRGRADWHYLPGKVTDAVIIRKGPSIVDKFSLFKSGVLGLKKTP